MKSPAALLFCLTAVSLSAATLQYESRSPSGEVQEQGSILFGSSALRIDHHEPGKPGESILYQAETDTVWLIDHDKKSYRQISKGEMDKLADSAAAALKEIDKHMAGLSPEQQALVKNMMGTPPTTESKPVAAAKATWVKSAAGDKVGDWLCDHYQSTLGNQTDQEAWTLPPATLGIGPDNLGTFQSLMTFFNSGFTRFMQSSPAGNIPAFAKIESDQALGLSGFPVKILGYQNGQPHDVWIVTSADKAPVPADQFAPPENYKKESLLPQQN